VSLLYFHNALQLGKVGTALLIFTSWITTFTS